MAFHIFVILSKLCPADGRRELVLVQAIFRHGQRNPASVSPNDENNPPSSWPQGLGELTREGLQQSFSLGQQMGERYSTFLGPSPSQRLRLVADAFRRSRQAAAATAAGLLSVSQPDWPEGRHQVPIDERSEMFRVTVEDCPKAEAAMEEARQRVIDGFDEEDRALLDSLPELFGLQPPVTLKAMYLVVDGLRAEAEMGRVLPDWADRDFIRRLLRLYYQQIVAVFGLPLVLRLRGGPLLREVTEHMVVKAECVESPDPSGCIRLNKVGLNGYSGHDLTLLMMLGTLGAESLVDGLEPGYTAALLFELWRDQDGYSVAAFYRRNDSFPAFVPVPISGCPRAPQPCPLDTFQRRSELFTATVESQECAMKAFDS